MQISAAKPRWAYLPECEAIPRDWSVVPFTSIADVNAGQSPPSDSYNQRNEGMPFLQGNGDFSSKYPIATVWCTAPIKIAEKGDTLFSVRAPVGEISRADREYAIGRGLVGIRASGCNDSFLFHALHHWRFSLQRVGQGTTFDAVTARHFSHLMVAVPNDRSEQVAIAGVLDAVDTALEHTRESGEQAQNLLSGVVADLLSRGVGDNGNWDNGRLRCPQENPGAFKLTALGRLPRDWRLSTVGNEFEVQSGFTLNSERRPRLQKRQYLRVANVQRDFLDLSDVQELEAKDDEFSLRILARDDLVVVEGHADSMQIGRCARVTEDAAGMTFQNHLFRLRTTGGMTAGFACIWLNSNYARRYWNARCATSSGLHTINQRMLKQLALPVPSPPEQRAISSIVEQCKRVRDAHFQKQTKLQNLKHSLTHELLTGKTRVSDLTEAPAS